MDIGLMELLIILVIVLLLFGGSRLPKLSNSIGQSLRQLHEGFYSKAPPPEEPKKSKNKKQTT